MSFTSRHCQIAAFLCRREQEELLRDCEKLFSKGIFKSDHFAQNVWPVASILLRWHYHPFCNFMSYWWGNFKFSSVVIQNEKWSRQVHQNFVWNAFSWEYKFMLSCYSHRNIFDAFFKKPNWPYCLKLGEILSHSNRRARRGCVKLSGNVGRGFKKFTYCRLTWEIRLMPNAVWHSI